MSFASVAKWLPKEQARLLREWLASRPEIPMKEAELPAASSTAQLQDGEQGAAGPTPVTILVGMLHTQTEMRVRPWCLLTDAAFLTRTSLFQHHRQHFAAGRRVFRQTL